MTYMDRQNQLSLLRRLAETYPRDAMPDQLDLVPHDSDLLGMTTYLEEHGLLKANVKRFADGTAQVGSLRITAKGLDFLADDGGLTAALSVVTVRLDADTLRALIEDRIGTADIPPEDRSRLMKWVKSAGSEALKEATQRLVTAALDQAPDAIRLLLAQLG